MAIDLIIVLTLIFAGLIFGLIAPAVGIGGGLMFVPFLTYVMDLDPNLASFTSSFVIIFSATSGYLKYRSQNRIDIETAKSFLILAIPGAIIGSYVALQLDAPNIKILFAIMVGFASVRGVLKAVGNSPGKVITKEIAEKKSLPKRSLLDDDGNLHEYYIDMNVGRPLAFLGGFVAGLLGVGGGIVYMPLLISFSGVPVHIAAATSTTMIIFVSIMAVITKSITLYLNGQFDVFLLINYGLPLAVGAVTGARIGAGRVKKIESRNLLIAFWSIAFLSAIRMGIGAL